MGEDSPDTAYLQKPRGIVETIVLSGILLFCQAVSLILAFLIFVLGGFALGGWAIFGLIISLLIALVPAWNIWQQSKSFQPRFLKVFQQALMVVGTTAVVVGHAGLAYALLIADTNVFSDELVVKHFVDDPEEKIRALERLEEEFGVDQFSSKDVVFSSLYRKPALANEFQRDLIIRASPEKIHVVLKKFPNVNVSQILPDGLMGLIELKTADCLRLSIEKFCDLETKFETLHYLENLNLYEGRSILILDLSAGLIWYQRDQW